VHLLFLSSGTLQVLQEELGHGGLGFKELGVRGAMFATAVLWARKSGLRSGNVSSVGKQVESASQALYKILEQHGPITASDCWKHASTMENHALKSKQHLKLMLRWMREKHRVNIVCQHKGDKKSSNPNDRQFLFSIAPPKVLAEPTEPAFPLPGV